MNIFLEIIKMRKKSFLGVLALVIINVLLYVFMTGFQESKLETLQNKWLEKRQRRSSGTVDKTFVYSQGKRDLAVFQARIPPKKDFTRVVSELFETASNNGLSVGTVGYKPELIKDRGLLVYNLTFSATGNYAGIKSFISDVERSQDILSIENIALKTSDTSQDSVTISMQISAFFRTERP